MTRTVFAAVLSLLLTLGALGQSVDWSQGVVYEYDGSGNVKKIGTDTYAYDTAQRLVRGSVAGAQQSYSYDSYGNRLACQQNGGDCQYGLTIESTTNRIKNRAYDKRGNLTQLPDGNTLEYDELGRLRMEDGGDRRVYYIYTADDERIAVYDSDNRTGIRAWHWTIRGLDKKPLREFTSDDSANIGTGNFRWSKDYIWRDGLLLATRQADPSAPGGVSTYHYHVDHLGTPRLVTDASGTIIGRHDYLPFGPEIPGNLTEPQQQTVRFTGHERDFARDHPPLDYMHARYYEGRAGRFLSVDPVLDRKKTLPNPQMWNRYVYAINNPVRVTDPDGKVAVVDDIAIGSAVLAVAAYLAAPSSTYPDKNNGQALAQSVIDTASAIGAAIGTATLERKQQRNESRVIIGENMDRVIQAAPQVPAAPLSGIETGPQATPQSVVALQTAIGANARIYDAGYDKDKKGLSPAYVAERETLRSNGYSPHPHREVTIDGKKQMVYEWKKDL